MIDTASARESAAITATALAAVFAAVHILVVPRMVSARHAEARIAAIAPATVTGPDPVALERRLEAIRDSILRIEARNRDVIDATAIYDRLIATAARFNLRPDQVNPSEIESDGGARIVRIHLSTSGPWKDVVAFIEAVAEMDAYARISDLSLGPAGRRDGVPVVAAQLRVEFLRFDIPIELRSLIVEADHDQR